MNYQSIYDSLCERGRLRPLSADVYYETHHIIPKCMGGDDSKDNLVELTYREHCLAHKLLTKIHPLHEGLLLAANFMSRLSESEVLYLNECRRKRMKESNPAKDGSWNKGINRYLRASNPVSEKEKEALRQNFLTNNPNADGRHTSKSITVTDGNETFHFPSLTSAEKFLREHTGLVMNHSSISTKMKKGLPYKGWHFKYD